MSIHDRGFASISPARLAEISAAGGRASHASGHAHQWTVKTARKAGRKGGLKSGETRKRQSEARKRAAGGDDAA